MSRDAAVRPADWDAATYDRLSAPQESWARDTIPRLRLTGDETVLDAGCGSGRVTRLVAEELPAGRVIGVDGSPAMIELARERLADLGDRVTLLTADLLGLTPRVIDEAACDAVFSNATFHWVPDHDELFRRLHGVMKPGARFVAQCGGRGNAADWVETVRRVSQRPEFADRVGGHDPWNFPGIDETKERMRQAGFKEIICRMQKMEIEPEDPEAFLTTAGLATHRERLPRAEFDRFTEAVIAELPRPLVFKAVRLNIEARA